MKILFFGDIGGKIGRQAVMDILPKWQKKYQPDIIIANADNATHGNGINAKHLQALTEAGIQVFTAGDHTLRRDQTLELLENNTANLLRPANVKDAPGRGEMVCKVGQKKLLVVSLLGQVFITDETDSPFQVIDKILDKYSEAGLDGILVDFHAEATSEKEALSWYLDGRVSAILGTHTHVQTADERIMPQGTAAISDVGFCGAVDSVIGVEKETVLNHFLTGKNFVMDIPETGQAKVNAVLVEIGDDGKAVKIDRLNKILNVK